LNFETSLQPDLDEVGNARLGRLDEAHVALARLLAINHKLTIAGFRAGRQSLSHAPELLDLYVAGFRLAGLPEG
jgi:hypothetical protein